MEVEAEQEKIRTYARQQMDTKDNDQYKALGRQQETCKETISDLETTEIEVLEEIDSHAEVSQAAKTELDEANAAKAKALGEIDERETNLKTKLEDWPFNVRNPREKWKRACSSNTTACERARGPILWLVSSMALAEAAI